MRLSIFPRLILGYLAISILFMAVTAYAITRLHQFNKSTRYILNVNNRALDYGKKLTDSFLSQLRYEKKYVISKDRIFYRQFLSAKDEFNKYLAEALSLFHTPEIEGRLDRVKASYEHYHSLIDEEVNYLTKKQVYSRKWYAQEKEKAANVILEQLDMLQVHSQQDTREKMNMLGETAASARKFAIVMSAMAIILVVIISLFITRSISKPLAALMDKTKEVSEGAFNCDLIISSPPEISELTKAFNSMCHKLNILDRMKSDFFSTMSHELRTPLSSIREGTNLLLEGIGGTVTDKQKKLLTIISRESNRLIGLVNSVLDLSKMEAGMMTYTFETASLTPLIDKAMLEIAPLVEAKKIGLQKKIDQNLPVLKIDPERMLQALRNLIGNAVKFTPDEGQVKVSARPVDHGVEVSVVDTGPGIPSENLTKIFDKFQQAKPSGPFTTKGTGLGLAIVKHIISSHGGRIWAESEPGRGSSFIFVLPV